MKQELASYSMKSTVERTQKETTIPSEKIDLPTPVGSDGKDRVPRYTSKTVYRESSQSWVRAYRFPVQLQGTQEIIELHGELSTKVPLNETTSIQVLLAGGSNAGNYWDWPLDPENHNYIRHATKNGFAVLNLDRPGYGKSDRGDPQKLNFEVQGHAIRQVLSQLRGGLLGYKFQKTVLHGHSMGGMTAWHASCDNSILDAVVVSGVGHNHTDEAMKYVRGNAIPIEEHPKYGLGLEWPIGYYARAIQDEPPTRPVDYLTSLLQDTVMEAELKAMIADSRNPEITKKIQIPVLFALGESDQRWCINGDCKIDPVYLNERDNYAEAADFTSFIIPDCGHLTNKDPGAQYYFRKVTEWLRAKGL